MKRWPTCSAVHRGIILAEAVVNQLLAALGAVDHREGAREFFSVAGAK
jgi:hypothetical protein